MSRHARPEEPREEARPPARRRSRHTADEPSPADWSTTAYGPYASGANAAGSSAGSSGGGSHAGSSGAGYEPVRRALYEQAPGEQPAAYGSPSSGSPSSRAPAHEPPAPGASWSAAMPPPPASQPPVQTSRPAAAGPTAYELLATPPTAPPTYQQPAEYAGRRRAPEPGPPMAHYLTGPTPPPQPAAAPVRRPTTPIPSAARARKPPKDRAKEKAKDRPEDPPRPSAAGRDGRLRLRINPITCDGHGLCAELLPELLALDDWNYPSPVVAEVPAELESHAQRAAQQCPTLAIVLERRKPRPDRS